uniref:RNase_PH domain-containing protein n=1 Tax=Meloidogyne hapla TaxID=6305 RepID=A0A1I8BTD3_MELHA
MLSEFGFRKDARLPKQIRNILYQTGVYSQADGSAYIEQGGTKVLCAVYGPREGRIKSRIQEESAIVVCQYSQSTFSVPDRRNRPRGDRRGNTNSRLLERAFESVIFVNLYPRSQIDIFFEADGGNLAACVNAGSLALADAGIPMRGLVSAIECGCVDGVPCADTSSREQSELIPRITIATNLVHRSHLTEFLKSAIDACAQIHSCLETIVFENVKTAHRL